MGATNCDFEFMSASLCLGKVRGCIELRRRGCQRSTKSDMWDVPNTRPEKDKRAIVKLEANHVMGPAGRTHTRFLFVNDMFRA